jgi:hypothetical protein
MLCFAFALALAPAGNGCGGGDEATDEVVVDEMQSIEDAHFAAYKLDPGTYKVELTASGDGATVKWVGSSCPGAPKQTSSYTVTCEMMQTGQLVIENPSGFGAGSGTTVTVKITRVAG